MLFWIIRRFIVSYFLVFPICITLIFFTSRVIPADPVRALVGSGAGPEQIEAMRHYLGLDKPLPQQFWDYINRLAHGDLGISFRTLGRPISSELRQYFPATVELTVVALVLCLPLSIFLGFVSALYSNKLIDIVSRFIALLGISAPGFWIALLVQLAILKSGICLPLVGRIDLTLPRPPFVTGLLSFDSLLAGDMNVFFNTILHLLMPAAVLAFGIMAEFFRIIRVSVLKELSSEYVAVARAKGLPERVILGKHLLRNALIPLVTIMGIWFGQLLGGGALVIEQVFAWPGIGFYAVQSALAMDFPAIMGVSILAALMVLTFNLLADIAYGLVDPRIQYT